MKRTKTIQKQDFKHTAGKCRLCGESQYELFDVHRIIPGADGGKYTYNNSVTLCCRCHRLVHDGQIIIDRYYPSTDGYVLRIVAAGVERFV